MDRRSFIELFLKGSGCAVATATLPWVRTASATPSGEVGVRFLEGVASGDPTPDSVILWTRSEPLDPSINRLNLTCEVSTEPDFGTLVATKEVVAEKATDYTVRVLVRNLQPGTFYYYRFRHGSTFSRRGRTLTAPRPSDDVPVRVAWASCQSYEGGYYGAYRLLIEEDATLEPGKRIAVVLHLGDFIYEKLGYGSAEGIIREVPPFPDGGEPSTISE
jgi:alkaline phosphatase D